MTTNKTIEQINEEINLVCANSHFCTDEEFSAKLKRVYRDVSPEYFINNEWASRLVSLRVKEFCEKRGINLEDYDGPLPYKQFKIKLK